jgi:protein CpxP
MKKFLLATAILSFGLGSIHAQDLQQTEATTSAKRSPVYLAKKDPQEVAAARASRLEKELDLTADQKQKVTAIFLEESQNKDKAVAKAEGETKIKAVLTKDQITKFDALKAQRAEAMQARTAN